jgi:hypothetical protein
VLRICFDQVAATDEHILKKAVSLHEKLLGKKVVYLQKLTPAEVSPSGWQQRAPKRTWNTNWEQPENKRSSSWGAKQGGQSGPKCFECQQWGHVARECPKRKGGKAWKKW